MRSLQISSLFLVSLFLYSCSLKTTKNLIEQENNTAIYNNIYFSNTKNDYIYKTKIDIYGNYFGGIMIFKKIKKNHHRVVFTTEFGNKIFDFDFNNQTFTKKYIIKDLDKKIIINTLKNDFKTLLKQENTIIKSYSKPSFNIFQSKDNNRYNFFYVNKATNKLEEIIHTSKTKEKVVFTFTKTENRIAKKINIEHKNIKLNINLNYINN